MHIIPGSMKPLQTPVGVISRRTVVEPHTDVAVIRGGVSARVQAPPHFDDVGAELLFGVHVSGR